MKLFRVETEHYDANEVITTTQYVTAHDDRLKTVVDHFTKHCWEYEKELKLVQEAAVIAEHIGSE